MALSDHDDVREAGGESKRKRVRMQIIKAFMKYQSKNKPLWQS